MSQTDRIVVTGLGSVSPHGVGTETFWKQIMAGASGVRETEDEVIAPVAPVVANVPDFNPRDYLDKKMTKNTAHFSQMGLVAAQEAVRTSGLKMMT